MYTLIACLGMWVGLCKNIIIYEMPSKQACEETKSQFPRESIENGYVLCKPGKPKKEKY